MLKGAVYLVPGAITGHLWGTARVAYCCAGCRVHEQQQLTRQVLLQTGCVLTARSGAAGRVVACSSRYSAGRSHLRAQDREQAGSSWPPVARCKLLLVSGACMRYGGRVGGRMCGYTIGLPAGVAG